MKTNHILLTVFSALVVLLVACAPGDSQPSAMPAVSTTSSQQPAVSVSPTSNPGFSVEILKAETEIAQGEMATDLFKVVVPQDGRKYHITPAEIKVVCYDSQQARNDIKWQPQNFDLPSQDGAVSQQFGVLVEDSVIPGKCTIVGKVLVKDESWNKTVYQSDELTVTVHVLPAE